MSFHFGKHAEVPRYLYLLRHLGSISDGITGLVMLPFGRSGTDFEYTMCCRILRTGVELSRKRKEAKDDSRKKVAEDRVDSKLEWLGQ